jgi:hypothetical protein
MKEQKAQKGRAKLVKTFGRQGWTFRGKGHDVHGV